MNNIKLLYKKKIGFSVFYFIIIIFMYTYLNGHS